MNWLKRANYVLHQEPESWLSYLYGQQFEKLKHLHQSKSKLRGGCWRILVWLFRLAKNMGVRTKPIEKTCDYLFFAGTKNQMLALEGTVEAFHERNINYLVVAPEALLTQNKRGGNRYKVIKFSPIVVIKSLLLASIRIRNLLNQLKDKNKLIKRHGLDTFLEVYSSLVYFDVLLRKTKPKLVIVSNDHNTSNRVLLAIARSLNIKTAYMQHASVSALFPALNFDYSFLDGRSALSIYQSCEKNRPESDSFIKERKIYLTGQKKKIEVKNSFHNKNQYVGVALNLLDSIDSIEKLVSSLTENSIFPIVRWHPALSGVNIENLKHRLSKYRVIYSNPNDESLNYYFSKVFCLIASNSSIHLEAAISGITPIYYPLGEQYIKDYYGYVRNAVAINIESEKVLLETIKKIKHSEVGINKEAIQFYSATYGTLWEGKEGGLVAEILLSEEQESDPPILTFSI